MESRGKRTLTPQAKLIWARFWARQIDVNVCIFPLIIAVVLIFPSTAKWNSNFTTLAMLPLSLVLCGVEQALFGQTIGKTIAGIRAQRDEGGKLALPLALRREAGVWVSGMGLGIPIVSLGLMGGCATDVRRLGKTRYDDKLKTDVVDCGSSAVRTWLSFFASLLILVALYGVAYLITLTINKARQPSVEAALILQANTIRSSLPKKLDNITSLIDVKASGKTITYVYQLQTEATSDQFNNAGPQLKAAVQKGYCGQGFPSLGVTSVYDYFAGLRHLGMFTLTPADCSSIR